ncbi:MAG: hypothetical protein WCQ54_06280 [Clostridiaceae bacterium]
MKKDYLYEPDYPYRKHPLGAGYSNEGYPIIERTNNGLIFPEGPKDFDIDQVNDENI